MKRFINKSQINNYVFFVIVELVILFMFKSAVNTNNIMANTFSIIIIVVFIVPVVLSYFSTDILPIFNNMIVPRFQTKKKFTHFIIEKIVLDSFKMTCTLLLPLHFIAIFIYQMNFVIIMRYYFSFFIIIMIICMLFIIVYFKVRNKNISIIITYCLSNITNLLSSLFRKNSIPNLVALMLFEYENHTILIVSMLLFIILLTTILYKTVYKFEILGESKHDYKFIIKNKKILMRILFLIALSFILKYITHKNFISNDLLSTYQMYMGGIFFQKKVHQFYKLFYC